MDSGVRDPHKPKLVNVFAGFFRSKRSLQSLASLARYHTRGWEKWWQHELLTHLFRNPQIAEVRAEYRVPVRGHSRRPAKHMYFDVAFRFKSYVPRKWFLVELKQSDDFRACLRRMKQDMNKFAASDRLYLSGLGRMAYVGVVPAHADQDEIQDYADELFLNEPWYPDLATVTIRRIGSDHKLLLI